MSVLHLPERKNGDFLSLLTLCKTKALRKRVTLTLISLLIE